ncbi:MAG: hypothetical protein REI78_13105 [Pedobacter sp.]|nr:hypothetical protein [Pedobacter sp.]MDQ8053965.1 hypothetical protein [Pedobacter sp.]
MKYLKLTFLLLLTVTSCFADTSGSGCRIDDKVYTEYLGMGYPYGTSQPQKRYYKNTAYVPIYYGYGYNQHQGYKCGFINIYPASSYWNGSENVPIPAENEINSTSFGGCVISTTLGGSPIREGDYVTFTYNRTGACASSLPLDDYIWLLFVLVGAGGIYYIRKSFRFSS